ncbi:hypothetical protein L682_01730 [Aquipseudomonas alcaligenes OT 69]|nr:hypothetical protein L682_01730 [Pseudomonas alcaligenes OT 69]
MLVTFSVLVVECFSILMYRLTIILEVVNIDK